jgi:probable phosphoglycerate mutase
VRHGETEWNALSVVQGQDDTARLNDKGRGQAQRVAESLSATDFDLIVTSDLARATETASIIGAILSLPREADPLLRERSFGVLEKGPSSELLPAVTGISKGVLVDPDARPVDGESFRDVVRRAHRFLERANDEWPTKRLLVVTHGGTIRALRASASTSPLEGLIWDTVDNCSLWTIQSRSAL